jgi:hypothetical protein
VGRGSQPPESDPGGDVMSKKLKVLPLLRVANNWMVGENISRVVPVHALQAFLATRYRSSQALQRIRDLARGEPSLGGWECFADWTPSAEDRQLLQRSAARERVTARHRDP